MLGISAEFQNVPLGDPHMLQEPPGGKVESGRLHAAKLRGEVGNRGVEPEVAAATAQKFQKVLSKQLVTHDDLPN
jgi:hypothetical protein